MESKLFVGRFYYKADKKGRTMIPSEFRRVIAARNPSCKAIWLIPEKRNDTPYIACYDEKLFDKKREKCLGADVECVTPDKQGRVVVKQWLRKYARLEDRIIVAASPDMGNFEIWNSDFFERAYRQSTSH